MPPDIVGRPAWELAKVLNDYFMGVSALPEDVSDAEFARNCAELLGTVDNSSQTPPEWQTLEPSEGPPEAAPESPPVRLGGADARARPARGNGRTCLLYTSPSPRDATLSRMPSSA